MKFWRWGFVGLLGSICMATASQAAPTHFDLYFAALPIRAGDTYHPISGVSGGFDYDPAIAQFSNFAVSWTHVGNVADPSNPSNFVTITQTDTFDMTPYANAPPLLTPDINSASLGLTGTAADNFTILSQTLPSSQTSPDYHLVGYTLGAQRQPGLGSIAGQGMMNFYAQYCGASCGSLYFGSAPDDSNTNFSTVASPFGTSNPLLMLSWGDGIAWSLSPIPTGPYFDIPEPETWTLAIVGLLGVGAALRRGRTTCQRGAARDGRRQAA